MVMDSIQLIVQEKKKGILINKLALELGDILYYISIVSHEMGYTLEDIAQMNISKLAKGYPDGFSREASQKRFDI